MKGMNALVFVIALLGLVAAAVGGFLGAVRIVAVGAGLAAIAVLVLAAG